MIDGALFDYLVRVPQPFERSLIVATHRSRLLGNYESQRDHLVVSRLVRWIMYN
jgi:hypothetical protein